MDIKDLVYVPEIDGFVKAQNSVGKYVASYTLPVSVKYLIILFYA